MNQINYLSDIKLLENYPKTDNFIYHFTTDGETCYNVSLEDGNCRKDGDYLVICLDNHGLPEGLLKVRREFHYPDEDFPDKEWTKIVEHAYDIYLGEGVDIEADQYVLPAYMPIFRGEKGDAYEITEEDYEEIAELAVQRIDLSDYYTKEEVEELFGEKLKYYTEGTDTANIRVAKFGSYASSVDVNTSGVMIEHTGPSEECNGFISINNNGIFFSHEGPSDAHDTNVEIKEGKIFVNDKAVALSDLGDPVNWQTFNSAVYKPEVGWKRVVRSVTPGLAAGYTGFAYTQRYGVDSVMQLFFVENSNTILYRSYIFSFDTSIDTSWKELSKTYTSGSGITVSSNGEISLTQKFKTVNGESIEGDGDIKVGSDLLYYKEEENQAFITVDDTNGIAVMPSMIMMGEGGEDSTARIAVNDLLGVEIVAATNDNSTVGSCGVNTYYSYLSYEKDGARNIIYVNENGAFINTNDKKIATSEDIKTVNDKITELELYKTPNVVIYGSPAISNGQISDFSQNDYLQFPFLVDFKQQYFLIQMCFTTGDNVSTLENIFDSEYGLAFAIRNGHFVIATSYDGQSWAGENVGTYNVLPNTTYYVKFRWLNGNYNLSYSLDNSTYNNDIQFYSLSTPYPKQIIIGKSANNAFSGIINLNYCSLYIGDREVWRGMDDVGLATRLLTDLENIDAAGEAKIKELAGGKYYFETEEDDGNERFREAGIRIQDEEAGTEVNIVASDYKSSENSELNVGFGVADPYSDSSINANPDAVELMHNHWIEGGEEGGYNISAALYASDDGVVMGYGNDESRQVILNNDGFFYNDAPIATEERVQELINAAIGDMDAILDIMLGTSDIDGQLNRIIG